MALAKYSVQVVHGTVITTLILAGCVDVEGQIGRKADVSQGPISGLWPADWYDTDHIDLQEARQDAPPIAGMDAVTDGAEAVQELPELVADVALELVDSVEMTGDLPAVDVCVPQCEDKVCGWDQCQGVCGICPEGKPVCSFGKCKKCKPECDGKECGADGCGGSCGNCPSKFSCLYGECKPPDCLDYELVFEENFDSCTQGAFDIIDFQPDDKVTWWALPLKPTSEPCALYLGNPETLSYFTGSSVHVKLLSPILTVPSLGAWRLTFSLYLDAYPVPHPLYPYDYDVLYLHFAPELEGDQQVVWSSKELLNSTAGETVVVALDVSMLNAVPGRFIFEFDTVDSVANDFEGIYLDDFRIETICPYCAENDHCDDEQPCTKNTCQMFGNLPALGSCLYPDFEDCCVGQEEGYCEDLDPCTEDSCDPQGGQCLHDPIEDCDPLDT